MSALLQKIKKAPAISIVKKKAPGRVKTATRKYMDGFKIKFSMQKDAIDLRTMSLNYPNNIIPLEDISKALSVVLGTSAITPIAHDYDPGNGIKIDIDHTIMTTEPYPAYLSWDDLYLWTNFQRDIAPNHVNKISRTFRNQTAQALNVIKITIKLFPLYP